MGMGKKKMRKGKIIPIMRKKVKKNLKLMLLIIKNAKVIIMAKKEVTIKVNLTKNKRK